MRFRRGRYVLFRREDGRRMYFTGKFECDSMTGDVFPRETSDADRAQVFQSAAHAYCFGREQDGRRRRALSLWRVKKIN